MPGQYISYQFSKLIRFAREKKLNLSEWGLCEHNNLYWMGNECFAGSEPILRLSLLDIKEQKDREYSEWGDEEVFVVAGRTLPDEQFKWFLLSKPEMDEEMERIEFDRKDLN